MSDRDKKEISATSPAPTPDEGAVLEWSCHKARKRPLLAVLVSALNLAFGIIVYYATERSAVFAGLALVFAHNLPAMITRYFWSGV